MKEDFVRYGDVGQGMLRIYNMCHHTDGLAAMTLAFQANNSGSNPDRCI